MKKIILIFVSVICTSMILVACLTSFESTNSQPDSLYNTHWNLIKLEGQPLLDGTKITMDVYSNNIKGFSGCNTYRSNGEVLIEKGQFQVPETARTTKDCQKEILSQEAKFIELLARTRLYKIEDNKLYLYDDQGEIILVFERK